MKGYTVYAKSTGMQIMTSKKETDTNKEGRIALRFFTFGNGESKSLRFVLNPVEAFGLCLTVLEVVKNGGNKSIIHKFEGEEGVTISTLHIEKWVKGDKSGYAMTLKRGDDAVNVPMDMTHFLFVGELMKTLSTEQAWSSYKGEEAAERAAEPVGVAEEKKEENATQKPAATVVTDSGTAGTIEAVRKDGKAFKVNGEWFAVNEETKIEGVKLAKGVPVTLQYNQGDRDKLASRIQPLSRETTLY